MHISTTQSLTMLREALTATLGTIQTFRRAVSGPTAGLTSNPVFSGRTNGLTIHPDACSDTHSVRRGYNCSSAVACGIDLGCELSLHLTGCHKITLLGVRKDVAGRQVLYVHECVGKLLMTRLIAKDVLVSPGSEPDDAVSLVLLA